MRIARVDDHRRHLREKGDRWKFRLERFQFEGIPSLGREELPFSSPLTVICGPNGVGKTTLLRAVRAAADPTAVQEDPMSAHKLPSGTATLGFHSGGTSKESTVTFVSGKPTGGSAVDVEVIHLDVAAALPTQQSYLCSFESAGEITEGTGHKALNQKDIDTLNHLARRNYKTAKLYEVDGGEGSILPFFEIELDNSSYDSRSMGAGEFAIFYIWWALTRASAGALVLIEEPECHLSPGSQSALCDFLFRMTDIKTLTVIMTTHSAKIVSKLDDDNLIFLYRDDRGVQVVRGQPSTPLLETVGIDPIVDTVVLVEDQAAAHFGRFLLQSFRPELVRRSEFVDRQGEGNITTSLKSSTGITSIGVIGLYDGDVRSSVSEEVQDRAAFLPGDEPIEKTLRKMLEGNVATMKVALDRPNLGEILFALKGADSHDWYVELCRQLGQTPEQLYPIVFRAWLRLEGNEAIALAAVKALAAKYKPRR